ncbi:MAG: hypothetical protein CHACPFDD_03107 [Phycisphaerae bacterium]|nr:hypothetical protein [Phycisphaerae bacterium]
MGGVHTGRPAGDPRFWSTEVAGSVTILRFNPGSICAGIDLQRVATLWEFFDELVAGPHRVLHISFASSELSHETLVRLAEYFRSVSADDDSASACDSRARTELAREDIAMQRYIRYLRDSRLFVVGSYQGEIDIHFLGLLLACDFRIAAESTVIVNRGHPLGVSPATAVPWFLVRTIGASLALDVLLESDNLPVHRAHELGLIHRITKPNSHEPDALAITQALAAKGTAHLLRLKRAMTASSAPLEKYLQVEGAGFQDLPVGTPTCARCGYNLTGNVSGSCPECGRPLNGA